MSGRGVEATIVSGNLIDDRAGRLAGAAGFEPVPMAQFTRWEYRAERHVARGPLEGLAELGAEGWELIAVSPTNMTGDMMLWFKRPVV